MKRFHRFLTLFLCFTMVATWGCDVSLLAAFAQEEPAAADPATVTVHTDEQAEPAENDESGAESDKAGAESDKAESDTGGANVDSDKASAAADADQSDAADDSAGSSDAAKAKDSGKAEKSDADQAEKIETDKTGDESGDKSGDMSAKEASARDAGDEKIVLKQQVIKAELIQEPLYETVDKDGNPIPKSEQKDHKTRPYKAVRSFWNSLQKRKPQGTEEEQQWKVTVSGQLPEGVTAEAGYMPLDEGFVHTERGILAIDLTLKDKDGKVYVPEKPVTVTIRGKGIKSELADDNAPILYAWQVNKERAGQYAEKYDKKFYAADVTVWKSEDVNKKLLRYQKYDEDK